MKISGLSKDIEQTEREKLTSVFPECFTEGKLDIDKLLNLCGEYITDDFERYEFKWKGKSQCLQLAQRRSTGTLRPCPEESVNFDATQNLYIEGDNLEVLKLLQASYYRLVKMIYIDPPYNTGNDFVYEDDFKDPLTRYKEVTQQTTKSNPESMGRFHTNWLNMMYPRLRLAANLLRDDGVIFISIDDGEQANLRKVCDEVFGEEYFVGCFIWKRRASSAMADNNVSIDHEYVMAYQKGNFTGFAGYEKDFKNYSNPDNDPRGPWVLGDLTVGMTASMRPNQAYNLIDPKTGHEYPFNPNRVWAFISESMNKMISEGRVVFPNDARKRPMQKRFQNELKSNHNPFPTLMLDKVGLNTEATRRIQELMGGNVFDYSKPLSLISTLLTQVGMDDAIILDFFSGSATTAHAVMQLNAEDGGNRRFIMVQLPELCPENSEAAKAGYKNICEIGKERIRRAGRQIISNKEQGTGKRQQDSKDQPSLLDKTVPCSLLPVTSSNNVISSSDTGFKVFKLDTSNVKTWDAAPVADDNLLTLAARMNGMIDRVKSDRSDLDVVYEIMLKMGVPLTYSVKKVDIAGKAAYIIGEDCLRLICLAPGVTPDIIEKMADYAPAKLILAENSLTDDTAMSNAHYILKDRNIELKLV